MKLPCQVGERRLVEVLESLAERAHPGQREGVRTIQAVDATLLSTIAFQMARPLHFDIVFQSSGGSFALKRHPKCPAQLPLATTPRHPRRAALAPAQMAPERPPQEARWAHAWAIEAQPGEDPEQNDSADLGPYLTALLR